MYESTIIFRLCEIFVMFYSIIKLFKNMEISCQSCVFIFSHLDVQLAHTFTVHVTYTTSVTCVYNMYYRHHHPIYRQGWY